MDIPNGRLARRWRALAVLAALVTSLFASGSAVADTLLDDFQDGNFWTPDTTLGWWDSDGSQVYQRTQVQDSAFASQVMRVIYNKSGYPWSFFAGSLSSSNPKRNFAVASGYDGNFNVNTVRVRVNSGTHERALLKLADSVRAEKEVAYKVFGRSLDGLPLTVDFNYSKLYQQGGINLGQIGNLMLFMAPGSTSALTSEKRLDDIQLVETALLDDFETDGHLNLTWFDTCPGTPCTLYTRQFPKFYSPPTTVSSDFAADQFGVMRVTYNKQQSPNYRFGATVAPAWSNFKAYRKLTFWVRNKAAPDVLRIGVQLENNSYNKSLIKYFDITTSEWTKVECDLADLYFNSTAVFDMATIRNILFSIVSTHTGQGVFDLDEVMLIH